MWQLYVMTGTYDDDRKYKYIWWYDDYNIDDYNIDDDNDDDLRLEHFLVSRPEGFCGLQNQQKAFHDDYNQYDGDGDDGDDGDDGNGDGDGDLYAK